MKTSRTWNYRSIVDKIMMGLVFAAMIGNIDMVPAFGKDEHKSMGKHDNGRYEQRGHGYERNRKVQGRRVYRSDDYRERGYAPPPVIYAPPPPPGIRIFFPPIIIHP